MEAHHNIPKTVIEPGRDKVSYSPLAPFCAAWQNRELVVRLAWREISAKYRGSVLGVLWALIVPVIMLAVYTFVFSVVFAAKWQTGDADSAAGKANFALMLFAGLIPFNFLSEVVGNAPRLILNYPSYVKRVVFPLEMLPLVSIFTALFNLVLSSSVLLLGLVFFAGLPPTSALTVPLLLLPLIFFSLGSMWILASLGVFFRDLPQIISIVLMLLMFLSPLFYPLSAVPAAMQPFIKASPLTLTIESIREALFLGVVPSLTYILGNLTVSLVCLWIGYLWFMNTKKGFADVI